MPIRSKAKVANARFWINFWDVEQPVSDVGETVFSDESVLDPSVRVPSVPKEPCGTKKEKLQKQAETDPDGADAEAIDSMSREEVVATAINTAGFLCARVTNLHLQNGDILAECVEYRNGVDKARYRIDTGSMTVTPY
jgi:hypothetical protein